MNLSETAFVANAWTKGSKQANNTFTLRWFTPTIEIELCGHATIAAARALFDSHLKGSDNTIKFETKFKGTLEAIRFTENDFSIDLPLNDCKPIDRNKNLWIEDIIENTLGSEVTQNDIKSVELSEETKYLLIGLKDSVEDLISKVSPDFDKLLRIDTKDTVKAVFVTQRPKDDKSIHFYSRFFAPWLGVNEDPVTGSAHTVLAPYWMRQYKQNGLEIKELIGKQCSKRGGIVCCRIDGDRVHLRGTTRIVVTGKLNL